MVRIRQDSLFVEELSIISLVAAGSWAIKEWSNLERTCSMNVVVAPLQRTMVILNCITTHDKTYRFGFGPLTVGDDKKLERANSLEAHLQRLNISKVSNFASAPYLINPRCAWHEIQNVFNSIAATSFFLGVSYHQYYYWSPNSIVLARLHRFYFKALNNHSHFREF